MKTPVDTTLPGSCGSCGIHRCHLNVEARYAGIALDRTAWLLDERWPEFDAWLGAENGCSSDVLLPRRGGAYDWRLPGASRPRSFPWLALQRSLAFRRLGAQGAKRQQVLEDFDQRFAAAYGARLSPTVTHLVVWQNLLPFLYLDKTLGGRTYDVLLWRAPRHELHRTLAEAQAHYPQSPTLNDFRSSPRVLEAEQKALQGARKIITPHAQLARLFPEKTTREEWISPPATPRSSGGRIAFLGPTLGRRGAYVVREAMRQLGLPFVVLGRNLEEPSFWQGMKVDERPLGPNAFEEIGLLIAPAITEFKPRNLLKALAQGIPVIATESCGLPPQPGLHFVDAFDADALARKIAGSARLFERDIRLMRASVASGHPDNKSSGPSNFLHGVALGTLATAT